MGRLNPAGMTKVAQERVKRNEAINKLIKDFFDPSKELQQQALSQYLDSFELSVNKMYLAQALSTGLQTWLGSWVVGRFLPIPEFINSMLTTFLYFGAAAYCVENLSITDFYEELEEMKLLYNWCLKGNNQQYTDEDNLSNLNSLNVQRLIKLLAPLCDTEFMIAWKKVSMPTNVPSAWSKTIGAGYSALSSTFSLFSCQSKPKIDHNEIEKLKLNVETRKLDVSVLGGFEQSIKYFATNSQFRELFAAKLKQPLELVKNSVPSILMQSAHNKIS